jgi:hypothetical protein
MSSPQRHSYPLSLGARAATVLAHNVECRALVGQDSPDRPLPILIHGPEQHLVWWYFVILEDGGVWVRRNT